MKPGLGRWLRTVRHLRARQLAGQVRWRLRRGVRPRPVPRPLPALAAADAVAFPPAPPHARFHPPGRLRLLSREVDFGERVDWHFAGGGPLWAYHLHQFDYLREPGLGAAERTGLLLDWIARCDGGPGWDPHPTSLRIAGWTRLLLTRGALLEDADARDAVRASLARQAATLAAHLETHLLANHYLSNLLAVTLAGLLLEGGEAERWRTHERRLRRELGRQILPDGLHEERSPMYHALLLELVLDCLNVGRAAGRLSRELERDLVDVAERMLGALRVLTHPDGEIALFADSAFGIAQPPARLEAYGASLDLAPRAPERPGLLTEAGYARLEAEPFVLVASLAGPGPAHQPGHAHCDALAFELSVAGERVVTDTGVAEYVPGPRRDWSRATRAHATLEVGGAEQAEIWASHRVGGRPRVGWREHAPGRRLEATCSGWSTPRSVHRRIFTLREGVLEIRDALEGSALPVRLTLPLAPQVRVGLDGDRARLALPGGVSLGVALPEGPRWRVERAAWFPEFGREELRPLLVADAEGFREGVWRFVR